MNLLKGFDDGLFDEGTLQLRSDASRALVHSVPAFPHLPPVDEAVLRDVVRGSEFFRAIGIRDYIPKEAISVVKDKQRDQLARDIINVIRFLTSDEGYHVIKIARNGEKEPRRLRVDSSLLRIAYQPTKKHGANGLQGRNYCFLDTLWSLRRIDYLAEEREWLPHCTCEAAVRLFETRGEEAAAIRMGQETGDMAKKAVGAPVKIQLGRRPAKKKGEGNPTTTATTAESINAPQAPSSAALAGAGTANHEGASRMSTTINTTSTATIEARQSSPSSSAQHAVVDVVQCATKGMSAKGEKRQKALDSEAIAEEERRDMAKLIDSLKREALIPPRHKMGPSQIIKIAGERRKGAAASDEDEDEEDNKPSTTITTSEGVSKTAVATTAAPASATVSKEKKVSSPSFAACCWGALNTNDDPHHHHHGGEATAASPVLSTAEEERRRLFVVEESRIEHDPTCPQYHSCSRQPIIALIASKDGTAHWRFFFKDEREADTLLAAIGYLRFMAAERTKGTRLLRDLWLRANDSYVGTVLKSSVYDFLEEGFGTRPASWMRRQVEDSFFIDASISIDRRFAGAGKRHFAGIGGDSDDDEEIERRAEERAREAREAEEARYLRVDADFTDENGARVIDLKIDTSTSINRTSLTSRQWAEQRKYSLHGFVDILGHYQKSGSIALGYNSFCDLMLRLFLNRELSVLFQAIDGCSAKVGGVTVVQDGGKGDGGNGSTPAEGDAASPVAFVESVFHNQEQRHQEQRHQEQRHQEQRHQEQRHQEQRHQELLRQMKQQSVQSGSPLVLNASSTASSLLLSPNINNSIPITSVPTSANPCARTFPLTERTRPDKVDWSHVVFAGDVDATTATVCMRDAISHNVKVADFHQFLAANQRKRVFVSRASSPSFDLSGTVGGAPRRIYNREEHVKLLASMLNYPSFWNPGGISAMVEKVLQRRIAQRMLDEEVALIRKTREDLQNRQAKEAEERQAMQLRAGGGAPTGAAVPELNSALRAVGDSSAVVHKRGVSFGTAMTWNSEAASVGELDLEGLRKQLLAARVVNTIKESGGKQKGSMSNTNNGFTASSSSVVAHRRGSRDSLCDTATSKAHGRTTDNKDSVPIRYSDGGHALLSDTAATGGSLESLPIERFQSLWKAARAKLLSASTSSTESTSAKLAAEKLILYEKEIVIPFPAFWSMLMNRHVNSWADNDLEVDPSYPLTDYYISASCDTQHQQQNAIDEANETVSTYMTNKHFSHHDDKDSASGRGGILSAIFSSAASQPASLACDPNGFASALSAGARFIQVSVAEGPMGIPILVNPYRHCNTTSEAANPKEPSLSCSATSPFPSPVASMVKAEAALRIIRDTAFVSTQFPLILAIDIRIASFEQQNVFALLLEEILGHLLYKGTSDLATQSISQAELMGKILLKRSARPALVDRSGEKSPNSSSAFVIEMQPSTQRQTAVSQDNDAPIPIACHLLSHFHESRGSIAYALYRSDTKKALEEDQKPLLPNTIGGKLAAWIKPSRVDSIVSVVAPLLQRAAAQPPLGPLLSTMVNIGTEARGDAVKGVCSSGRSALHPSNHQPESTTAPKGSAPPRRVYVEVEEDDDDDADGAKPRPIIAQEERGKGDNRSTHAYLQARCVSEGVLLLANDSPARVTTCSSGRHHQHDHRHHLTPLQRAVVESDMLTCVFPSIARSSACLQGECVDVQIRRNLNPIRVWSTGANVAAMHVGAWDLGRHINAAFFSAYGSKGYVLKPEHLRRHQGRPKALELKANIAVDLSSTTVDANGNYSPGRFGLVPDVSPSLRKTLRVQAICGQCFPLPKDTFLAENSEFVKSNARPALRVTLHDGSGRSGALAHGLAPHITTDSHSQEGQEKRQTMMGGRAKDERASRQVFGFVPCDVANRATRKEWVAMDGDVASQVVVNLFDKLAEGHGKLQLIVEKIRRERSRLEQSRREAATMHAVSNANVLASSGASLGDGNGGGEGGAVPTSERLRALNRRNQDRTNDDGSTPPLRRTASSGSDASAISSVTSVGGSSKFLPIHRPTAFDDDAKAYAIDLRWRRVEERMADDKIKRLREREEKLRYDLRGLGDMLSDLGLVVTRDEVRNCVDLSIDGHFYREAETEEGMEGGRGPPQGGYTSAVVREASPSPHRADRSASQKPKGQEKRSGGTTPSFALQSALSPHKEASNEKMVPPTTRTEEDEAEGNDGLNNTFGTCRSWGTWEMMGTDGDPSSPRPNLLTPQQGNTAPSPRHNRVQSSSVLGMKGNGVGFEAGKEDAVRYGGASPRHDVARRGSNDISTDRWQRVVEQYNRDLHQKHNERLKENSSPTTCEDPQMIATGFSDTYFSSLYAQNQQHLPLIRLYEKQRREAEAGSGSEQKAFASSSPTAGVTSQAPQKAANFRPKVYLSNKAYAVRSHLIDKARKRAIQAAKQNLHYDFFSSPCNFLSPFFGGSSVCELSTERLEEAFLVIEIVALPRPETGLVGAEDVQKEKAAKKERKQKEERRRQREEEELKAMSRGDWDKLRQLAADNAADDGSEACAGDEVTTMTMTRPALLTKTSLASTVDSATAAASSSMLAGMVESPASRPEDDHLPDKAREGKAPVETLISSREFRDHQRQVAHRQKAFARHQKTAGNGAVSNGDAHGDGRFASVTPEEELREAARDRDFHNLVTASALAVACVPLVALRGGYRAVTFRRADNGHLLDDTTLLCYFEEVRHLGK